MPETLTDDREFLEVLLLWLASFSRAVANVQAAIGERLREDAGLSAPPSHRGPTLSLIQGGVPPLASGGSGDAA